MKVPRAQASMRYSGQWVRRLCRAPAGSAMAPLAAVAWRRGAIPSASRLEAGIERHAAVDEQADAVHVVRVVRRDPHGGAADLVGFADPLVRNELHQLVVGFGRIPGLHVDRRADRAGANGIDANAE